jgi:hypothetical protein
MRQSAPPLTVIEPRKGWVPADLKEIWNYRELLYFLTKRDIQVRYKQTVLGGLWAIIQPAFTMIVFTLFFGQLAKMPSEGIAYPIFVYAGLLPWTYFANAVSASGNSLVGSSNLITKVYFPRIMIPASAALAGLLDFAVAVLVLAVLMVPVRSQYGIVALCPECPVPGHSVRDSLCYSDLAFRFTCHLSGEFGQGELAMDSGNQSYGRCHPCLPRISPGTPTD